MEDEVASCTNDLKRKACEDQDSTKIFQDTNDAAAETTKEADNGSSEVADSDNGGIKGDALNFKMVWNKTNYAIELGNENTVLDLRDRVLELTGIPHTNQKIMFKGLVKDDAATLTSLKIVSGSKVMVIGSRPTDIESVKTPTKQELREESIKEAAATKEPLCKQTKHKKVLDKGKPDDVPAGVRGKQERLPAIPLHGFVNKAGGKVRLTFKLEVDQLWLGTKERTEKLTMSSIRNVVNETIEGQEEYSIVGIQLGPTEASRYWLYWFPTQFTEALKETILGKWQPF